MQQQPVIRYDLLVQDALRGMVRDLLVKASREGLPGEHHFFVTFKTNAPGVHLSTRMKAQYPEEITIVLQHQFWDLVVNERQFEVGLSFGNIPERLVVPFAAVTGFHDPSVPFMLKFEPKVEEEPAPGPVAVSPAAKTPAKAPAPAPALRPQKIDPRTPEPVSDAARADDADEPPAETKVVSIDAFRKKT